MRYAEVYTRTRARLPINLIYFLRIFSMFFLGFFGIFPNFIKTTAMASENKKIRHIQSRPQTSEKEIEKHLCEKIASHGGKCLKYSNPNMAGYPDRLCILPGLYQTGVHVFFVEVKSKGKRPTTLQSMRMTELSRLGVLTYVCDSKESVDEIILKYL